MLDVRTKKRVSELFDIFRNFEQPNRSDRLSFVAIVDRVQSHYKRLAGGTFRQGSATLVLQYSNFGPKRSIEDEKTLILRKLQKRC